MGLAHHFHVYSATSESAVISRPANSYRFPFLPTEVSNGILQVHNLQEIREPEHRDCVRVDLAASVCNHAISRLHDGGIQLPTKEEHVQVRMWDNQEYELLIPGSHTNLKGKCWTHWYHK